jgi:class 3 adenylate cyclase
VRAVRGAADDAQMDLAAKVPPIRYAKASDGASIAYQIFGHGRLDLVWTPGLWHPSHLDVNWELPAYARFLRSLGRCARVIMYDPRGIGLSDRVYPEPSAIPEVYVDDLGAVLESALTRNTVLFGADDGAQVCARFAAAHPKRVRGLILYGMAPNGEEAFGDLLVDDLDLILAAWGTHDSGLGDAREMMPSLVEDEAAVAWNAKLQRCAVSPGGIEPIARTLLAMDVRDILPAVSVPTLVLHRGDDAVVPSAAAESAASAIPGARLIVLPGRDHVPFSGPWEAVTDAVSGFLRELGGGSGDAPRRLATVMFTDIVRSTERASELGDGAWRQVLAQHDALAREHISSVDGVYVKSTGDGCMATFDSPERAIRCIGALGRDLRELGLSIRAGIHTGEVETVGADLMGVGVHIAARVSALAADDEVLVSSTVKDLTAGSGFRFEDAGEHALKGMTERWRLYRVVP